jgi:hypothetical protein
MSSGWHANLPAPLPQCQAPRQHVRRDLSSTIVANARPEPFSIWRIPVSRSDMDQGRPSGCGSGKSPVDTGMLPGCGLLPNCRSQVLSERNWVQRRQRCWKEASFDCIPGNVQFVVLSPVRGSITVSQAVSREKTRNRRTASRIIFSIFHGAARLARTETTAGSAGRPRSSPGSSSVRRPWRSHRMCSHQERRPGCSPASTPAS